MFMFDVWICKEYASILVVKLYSVTEVVEDSQSHVGHFILGYYNVKLYMVILMSRNSLLNITLYDKDIDNDMVSWVGYEKCV